ncbi:KAP family P-loop NTPase fold protein [Nocardia brasiliensis]|uniref:KAP family P-loop NTPase fold protein n=1 Tax=Nocardia brasiliensis TaxID=37326 RepID=UPI00245816CC|nr:P-loop NTPase fold protein [Nocardia brasiliensis]
MSRSTDGVLLHPQDLIADNEIESADKDKLAHERIAAQLAALVTTVPPQSNVALYGSWGSGKSSVANMLRAKLTANQSLATRLPGIGSVKFARFDAFKYAETPLRRNFISAIANELNIKDQRFHAGLYAERKSTNIDLSLKRQWKVPVTFLLLMVIVAAFIASAVAVIAFARQGDSWENFKSMAKAVAVAGLLPATLISGLVSLASNPFQVEQKTDRPESDEQFEDLFKELVEKSGARLLVVFVDELDRCSANTVASTLDTIRTFFRAEKCVFVVAADRRALEEAITCAEETQKTPPDTVNPYYSTGSAYLDKVFQYQISLPALLPHRVTQFALDLVSSRGGVWSEINTPYVVSVLVPTHIASPRRVKHLLNTFTLTYRLAQDRHRQKLLAEDPRDNPGSLARLVCLDVEFPLFARDLEIDARLPQYVLQLKGEPGAAKPGSASDAAWDLAKKYAQGNAAPALVIPAAATADTEDAACDAEDTTTSVTQAHTKQLLDYLTRTRDIDGPSRDLVFLHSPGTAFGLNGELAITIELAAENGSIDDISARIAALGEPDQEAALKLLIQQINTGIGLGVSNAARTFLALIGVHNSLPVHKVADAAAAAINHAFRESRGLFDGDAAESAWHLAGHGTENESKALRRSILATVTAEEWDYGVGFVLSDPQPAIDADPQALGALVAREVLSDNSEIEVQRLSALNDEVLSQVLVVARDPLQNQLYDDVAAHDEWEDAVKDAAQAPPAPGATAQAVEQLEEPFDPGKCINALAQLAQSRVESNPSITIKIMSLLLNCDNVVTRNAVEEMLRSVEKVSDEDLIELMLTGARRRNTVRRSIWFYAIDPVAVTDRHVPCIRTNLDKLWTETLADSEYAEIEVALTSLSPLLKTSPEAPEQFDLTAAAVEKVSEEFADSSEAGPRSDLLARTTLFVAAGTVDEVQVGRHLIDSVNGALGLSWPAVEDDAPFLVLITDHVARLVTVLAQADAGAVPEELLTLLSGVKTCSWLPELGKTKALLHLIDATGSAANEPDVSPSSSEIAALIASHGSTAMQVCVQWIDVVHPRLPDIDMVIDYLIEQNLLTPEVASAVNRVRSTWTDDEQVQFVTKHLSAHDQPMPSPYLLKTVGFTELKDSAVAQLLVDRFNSCKTNPQRRTITALWAAAEITDDQTRRRLIEEIILPMLRPAEQGQVNKGQVEIALDSLSNVGVPLPTGIKRRLGKAIKQATADDEKLAAKAERISTTLGYETYRSGLLRRTKVNYEGVE